jgi:DNA-binding response OmpR family regulator
LLNVLINNTERPITNTQLLREISHSQSSRDYIDWLHQKLKDNPTHPKF